MLNIINYFLLSFCFNSLNIEKILPPLQNIYSSDIHIPLIGKQNIEYERTKKYESEVRLKGILNEKGTVFFDNKNVYNYSFDNILQKIIDKYKCELYNPYYNKEDDVIVLKFEIKILKFGKTIILENINIKK